MRISIMDSIQFSSIDSSSSSVHVFLLFPFCAKEDLLYPNDHWRCVAELQRLQKKRLEQDENQAETKGGKWPETHASFAETCFLI